MKKKYLFFSVFFILFVFLFSSIAYIFYASKIRLPVFHSSLDDVEKNLSYVGVSDGDTWQDRFLKMTSRDYSPAVESFSMFFDLDTSFLQEKTKFYQLILDKNDIYSLFCLKQTLNSFDLKYSITRAGDKTDVFLDTDNKFLLEQIQKALLVYDINTQIKEIWL